MKSSFSKRSKLDFILLIFIIFIKTQGYAIQDIPIKMWGKKCLDDLEIAKKYIKQSNHFPKENLETWYDFFKQKNSIEFYTTF
jgi:hypothetical protein